MVHLINKDCIQPDKDATRYTLPLSVLTRGLCNLQKSGTSPVRNHCVNRHHIAVTCDKHLASAAEGSAYVTDSWWTEGCARPRTGYSFCPHLSLDWLINSFSVPFCLMLNVTSFVVICLVYDIYILVKYTIYLWFAMLTDLWSGLSPRACGSDYWVNRMD